MNEMLLCLVIGFLVAVIAILGMTAEEHDEDDEDF